MRNLAATAFASLVLLILPCAAGAQAQLAYTSKNAHLRAGPARDYPVVAILPAGLEIAVEGCLSDYSWCDVMAGPSRGWLYAGNISYAYNGAYVPLITYGPEIGIGVIGFMLLDYWTAHYHDRSWYRDRDEWVRRHGPGWPAQPGRAAAPPPGRPGQEHPGLPQRGQPDHNRPAEAHREPLQPPGGQRPQASQPRGAQHPQPSQPRGEQRPQPSQPRGPAGPAAHPPEGRDREAH